MQHWESQTDAHTRVQGKMKTNNARQWVGDVLRREA